MKKVKHKTKHVDSLMLLFCGCDYSYMENEIREG
jgi:hypothetical protein